MVDCLFNLFYVVDVIYFFFKQKTAYEMRISDWSSDVCSSDLPDAGSHCGHLEADLVQLPVLPGRPAIHSAFADRGRRHRRRLRSEERRVGKECVSTCRSRWSPYHSKKKLLISKRQKNKR